MRIRKSLRSVPSSDLNSIYTLNYVPNQPITCHLNQSPWDVTTPPEQEQEDGDEIILFGTKIGTKRSRNVVPTGLCIREEEHRATNGSGPTGLRENPTSQDKGEGTKAVVDGDEANLRVNRGNKGKDKALVIDDEASLRETRASRGNKGKEKAVVDIDEVSQREKRASRGNKGKEKAVVDIDGASERKPRASRESKGKEKAVDEASPIKTRASRKSKGKAKEVVVIDDDDDVEMYCAVINNDGWQCGEPVKKGFHFCKRHWQNISPLVGRKRKPPTKTPSSSSRQRGGGGDKDQSETPENEKQGNYFYY